MWVGIRQTWTVKKAVEPQDEEILHMRKVILTVSPVTGKGLPVPGKPARVVPHFRVALWDKLGGTAKVKAFVLIRMKAFFISENN